MFSYDIFRRLRTGAQNVRHTKTFPGFSGLEMGEVHPLRSQQAAQLLGLTY